MPSLYSGEFRNNFQLTCQIPITLAETSSLVKQEISRAISPNFIIGSKSGRALNLQPAT
jgi:hypothetical protein